MMQDVLRKQVRGFNRFFAVKLRFFNRYVFGTAYSLIEGRIIGEIGRNAGCTANQIAESLDMDKSYLSRVLAKLENSGLIDKLVSENDSRKKHLNLTPNGHVLFNELEELSNAQVDDMLAGLDAGQIEQVLQSMRCIQSILGDKHG
jgi:DNA-binding MarR family transcriptional regulator